MTEDMSRTGKADPLPPLPAAPPANFLLPDDGSPSGDALQEEDAARTAGAPTSGDALLDEDARTREAPTAEDAVQEEDAGRSEKAVTGGDAFLETDVARIGDVPTGSDAPEASGAMEGVTAGKAAPASDPAMFLAMTEISLRHRERELGRDDPATLVTMDTAAKLRLRLGVREGTGELLAGLASARERILGPDCPDTVESFLLLGTFLMDGGRTADGRDALAKAVSGGRAFLGSASGDGRGSPACEAGTVFRAGLRLAEALRLLERPAEADEAIAEARVIAAALPGTDWDAG
ncbi:MAG: hypothetical protein LBT40_01180 [Deltaproteobacteria bacterium]|jgi:hypothetical protein|nr:hypothetical protein [Deltaproteobacteria bacterium]